MVSAQLYPRGRDSNTAMAERHLITSAGPLMPESRFSYNESNDCIYYMAVGTPAGEEDYNNNNNIN